MNSYEIHYERFLPTLESVRTHQVPQWYKDAKLGIFIHWGAYSVPAFAPPTWELGEVPTDERWFSNNPYAEWYMNSIRLGYGPTWDHHVKTYGADFKYEQFTDLWQAENWDPRAWASLFLKSGARYVVPTTKHHDGFCLWPSQYSSYNTSQRGPKRDIIGELNQAVRAEGLKFGVYYSGILDWTYTRTPIRDEFDVHNPVNVTSAYADYAFNQVMELIDTYQPEVLWNDIDWPVKGIPDLPTLFSYYYNQVQDGVINDRWNGVWSDYSTKEYQYGEITAGKKWEMVRGLGLSFGYNQMEGRDRYLKPAQLIGLLVSCVSQDGNLLINVGPKADGTIPVEQEELLLSLGAWLAENGEAIYATTAWTRQHEKSAGQGDVYFTRKDRNLYVILDQIKPGQSEFKIENLPVSASRIKPLGQPTVKFRQDGESLVILLETVGPESPAVAFVLPEYLD